MKILQITRNFPPTICGVGDYTYHLSEELRQTGVDTTILTINNTEVSSANFKIIFTSGFGLGNIISNIKIIKKNSPDIVNLQYVAQMNGVFGFSIAIGLLAFFIKLFTKATIVTTFHELYIPLKAGIFFLPLGLIQRLNFILILLFSDKVIVTTDKRKSKASIISKDKVYIIPVGSNISNADLTDEEKLSLIEKYTPKGEKLLITFGTSSRDKDYLSVINTFANLKMIRQDVKLLMIGDIGRDNKVFKKIKEAIDTTNLGSSVVLTGRLQASDVSKMFQIADFFIVHQRKGISTGSGTIACAFEHSLPVIANQTGNEDSFFVNHQNIIYIPMDGSSKSAELLDRIIKDRVLIEKISSRMKEDHDRELSWNAIAKRYMEVFESLTI